MNLTKDEIKELAKECPNIVFHIHIYPEGVVVSPAPTPAPDPTPEYSILFVSVPDDKPNKEVKLRPSPSPSVPEIMRVKHGEPVEYLEHEQSSGGENFLMVRYAGITGWIEEKYLVAK